MFEYERLCRVGVRAVLGFCLRSEIGLLIVLRLVSLKNVELQLLKYHKLGMPPKSKKKTKVSLERMLLEPIPETPLP